MQKNKLVPRLKLLLLLCSFFLVGTAYCWGPIGHRVVAEIAQQHLSKKAKKEIKKLIGQETLAWWANWPDFIKSDSTWNYAYSWHYVNFAGNSSKQDLINFLQTTSEKNLYSQIKFCITQLKDKSIDIEKRREALKFLIHFIGDLHQPLHVGRKDDQGGNKISVTWFDKKTNLHSIWDTQLIEFQQYSYTEYARLLDIANDDQVKAWQSGTLEDWFYESASLADKIYASVTPEEKLGYRYNFLFQKTLDEQLLKGGLRLAIILNQTFD